MAYVLVVDDEPIIAMTIGDWLEDLGHVVVGPAADLASALHLADQHIDAAILDIALGAETTMAVLRRLEQRKIPFAIASGHDATAMIGDFKRGLLLPKPFGFEKFRLIVERLLAPSRT